MLPLILYNTPDPKAVMHPQTITAPPPCITIWWRCWGPICSPSPIQHQSLPHELNLFIFLFSLKITCFQSSMVQFPNLWTNLKHARTCLWPINCFLCCTCAPNLASLKTHFTMMSNNNLYVLVPSQPLVTKVTQRLSSRSARSFGAPPLCLTILCRSTSLFKCATKEWLSPLKQQLCE